MGSHPLDPTDSSCSAKSEPPAAEHPRLPYVTEARRGWHAFACHDELLGERIVQVAPIWIVQLDEPDFPSTRPALECLLPSDSGQDQVMSFGINQPVQTVAIDEIGPAPLPMLPCTTLNIRGHADIERAMRPVRQDVDPPPFHFGIISYPPCLAKAEHPRLAYAAKSRASARAVTPSVGHA
jgi:hypothetical protein